jgi:hypothetical protein
VNSSLHPVIDRVTRVAPFGLGLWDSTAARLVSEGFVVRVYAIAAGGGFVRPVPALPGRAGIFVPHDLFGPGSFDEAWRPPAASPPAGGWLVEVRDPLDRYLSFVLHVDQVEAQGLLTPSCLADLAVPDPGTARLPAYVPLFRLASSPVPAGMAAVRGSFVDAPTGKRGRYAVMEVAEPGRVLARGIADDRGEALAVFPYPEVPAPPPWSPPGAPSGPLRLADQSWPIEVTVRYRRDLPRYTLDPSRPALPDVCELIHQPPATVSTSSPPIAIGGLRLRYGEELVLGGAGSADVLINPA